MHLKVRDWLYVYLILEKDFITFTQVMQVLWAAAPGKAGHGQPLAPSGAASLASDNIPSQHSSSNIAIIAATATGKLLVAIIEQVKSAYICLMQYLLQKEKSGLPILVNETDKCVPKGQVN